MISTRLQGLGNAGIGKFAYICFWNIKQNINIMETIAKKINEIAAAFAADAEKAVAGNKAAAARCRKATLDLEKLGKEFRKVSIAETK